MLKRTLLLKSQWSFSLSLSYKRAGFNRRHYFKGTYLFNFDLNCLNTYKRTLRRVRLYALEIKYRTEIVTARQIRITNKSWNISYVQVYTDKLKLQANRTNEIKQETVFKKLIFPSFSRIYFLNHVKGSEVKHISYKTHSIWTKSLKKISRYGFSTFDACNTHRPIFDAGLITLCEV